MSLFKTVLPVELISSAHDLTKLLPELISLAHDFPLLPLKLISFTHDLANWWLELISLTPDLTNLWTELISLVRDLTNLRPKLISLVRDFPLSQNPLGSGSFMGDAQALPAVPFLFVFPAAQILCLNGLAAIGSNNGVNFY